MSNEKQTSGEWVFCNYVNTKQRRIPTEIWAAGAGKGKLIAKMNYDPDEPELCNEKVLANIKLLRASKDMLTALEEIVLGIDAATSDIYDIKKATE